jgi:hypothetical protein
MVYLPAFDITTENNCISMGTTSVDRAYMHTSWSKSSDARYKTNFSPVPHGLDFVTNLQPISYQFKQDRKIDIPRGPVRYGFKAQDILALEGDKPVIVDISDPEYLKITSDDIIPVLVNALKELNGKFEELNQKYTDYVANHP